MDHPCGTIRPMAEGASGKLFGERGRLKAARSPIIDVDLLEEGYEYLQ